MRERRNTVNVKMFQEDERLLSKPILFLSYDVVLPLLLFLSGKPYYYYKLRCTSGSRIHSHTGFEVDVVGNRSKLKSVRSNELEGFGNRGLLITHFNYIMIAS